MILAKDLKRQQKQLNSESVLVLKTTRVSATSLWLAGLGSPPRIHVLDFREAVLRDGLLGD